MATTAVGMADFTNAFKQVIEPSIQDNVPKQAKLLQVMKKNENVQFFNNAFYAPVRSTRHGGVTNLANDKTKLVTGNAAVVQASVTPKILTGTFDISDMVDAASRNDKGAVESAMTFQTNTLTGDFSKQANRQMWSDGVGALGMVPASGGSVGVGTLAIQIADSSLDDGRGDAAGAYGVINGDIEPWTYLAPGQLIGVGTAGAAFATITSVTGGTALGTIVTTGAVVTAANDAIYIADGDLSALGTSEIQGVRAALSVGTANYAGLARSNISWSPQISGTAGNQALTINNMEVIYFRAFKYAQPGDRYAWFMNHSLYSKYGDLLTSLRRTVNKMELTAGWSGLDFEVGQGNVPVMLDFDVPDGEAILLNLDTWTVCQTIDMGFIEDGKLRRSDYLTFQKVFRWYTNMLCVAPAANGRMVRQTK